MPPPRNRHLGFNDELNQGFVVAFTIFWEVIEVKKFGPSTGATRALDDFIAQFEAAGWRAEGDARYGFTFMYREGVRILLEATPRDPYDKSAQSFNPFK